MKLTCPPVLQTETMLKTAEGLAGPYVWGQYDILVLPPSFPYGGMENPCLTFATPTLLVNIHLSSPVRHVLTCLSCPHLSWDLSTEQVCPVCPTRLETSPCPT